MPASTSPLFADDDARLTREIGIVDTLNDLASAIIHQRFQGTYDSLGADFAHYLYEIGAAVGVAEWSPEQVTARQPFVGMLSPEDLPGLTAEPRRWGFGEAEIRKIYHENQLRVMRQVLQEDDRMT